MPNHRLVLFCGLALLVLGLASWVSGADLVVHPLLRLDPQDGWVRPAARLTGLGEPRVLVPVVLLAAAVLAVRRRWRDALWLVLTVGSGRLLVEGVKILVHRPRPPLVDRLQTVNSWSFPSAHSANTMLTALAIAIVAGGGPVAVTAALAATAAIGWTRLALAVHWPGDVLGGWGIGLAWIGAALWARRT